MTNAKSVSCPLGVQFKLSKDQEPQTSAELIEMSEVPYASAIGSLMYAVECTRPDLAYAVSVVSRFLSNPGREHWEAVKWILRYLKGTTDLGLCYGTKSQELTGFTDSDLAGDLDSKRSTSGYMFCLNGGAISWQSKLQKCVALSTTEAEYIAITEACKEMLWLRRLFEELGIKQETFEVLCDSQSAIHLSRNPAFHAKSKHIQIRYHWVRDTLDNGEISLGKVHTSENGADMLTKTLPKGKHNHCCDIAGLCSCTEPATME